MREVNDKVNLKKTLSSPIFRAARSSIVLWVTVGEPLVIAMHGLEPLSIFSSVETESVFRLFRDFRKKLHTIFGK